MTETNRTAARPRSGPGFLLLALGLLAAGVFIWLEVSRGGFPLLRQYGMESLHRLPAGEVAFHVRFVALLLPAGILGGLGLSLLLGRRPFTRLMDRVEELPERTFLLAALSAGAALVLLVGLVVLRNQPVTDDERVYLFQADLLSRGRLYADSYPLSEFFDNIFVINNGRWFGKYPPGHPLALVPGVAVGFPRLVPALLAALNLFLFYGLAQEFFSRRASRAAVLLLLTSPFFLFTGATLLSHGTCLAALQAMGLAARRALRGGGTRWGVLAGAGGGFAFITRPYTALLLGVPVALAWGWSAWRKRARWRPWLAAAGVALAFLALFLAANWTLTGSPWRTGYSEIQGYPSRVLGFGDVFPGRLAHTPLDGLLNLGRVAARLNLWLWGWPFSWCFIIAALFWAQRPQFRILWGLLGAMAAGSVFYFSMGIGETGPVKYYEVLPVLALLTMAGLSATDQRLSRAGRPALAALAPGLLLAFTLLGWGFFARIEAADLRRITARIAEPYRLVDDVEDPRLLVFTGVLQKAPFESWVFSAPNNLPDHDRRVLYVRNLGSRNRELMARMPDRVPYLLEMNEQRQYRMTRLTGDEATRRAAEDRIREGILFLRQKKIQEAVDAFGEATRIDPEYPRSYLLLGWAFEQAGRHRFAEQAYRKAAELNPNDPDTRFFLGRFLGRRGRWKDAEDELTRAQALSPGDKDIRGALDRVRHHITP